MIRAGVVGATGYAGAELVRILAGHPGVKLTIITSRQYAGEEFETVFPSMTGVVNLKCSEFTMDNVCELADVVFLALPHKLPMLYVPELLERGKRVIDLSADFRFKDGSTYEAYYQPHSAKDFLDESVYGLCEVYPDQIKTGRLIGNPGCYPTSVLLPLIPLLRSGMLDLQSIIVDSKSGISGAGRSLSLKTHFCEINESFKAYSVAQHRHNPEMEEILSSEAGEQVRITFVPHLVPLTRGMQTTIYTDLHKDLSDEDVKECISSFYAGAQFVRINPDHRPPDTLHVKGTNYCDIGFHIDERHHRLILMSAIDNLIKGAAGQAVQNMNIMLGFDETIGLSNIPFAL
ncbi:MAG: N-acetyl-gamma-glutamyl-phosphate reductase [Desulfobacterales bacterium]